MQPAKHPESWSQTLLGLAVSALFIVSMVYIGCDSEAASPPGRTSKAESLAGGRVSAETILGPAAPFNIFVLGDLHQWSTDIQGRAAVMGDVQLSGFGLGSAIGQGRVLVVGGDAVLDNGQVNGDIQYGGELSGSANILGVREPEQDFDFSGAAAQLQQATQELLEFEVNGSTGIEYGTVKLVGQDARLNVFQVDAEVFAGASGMSIEVPGSSSVIVNVMGESVRLSGFETFLHEVQRTSVLFNFPETLRLEICGFGVQGTILAPYAATRFDNGQIDGQLVVRSLVGTGESHEVPYDPPEVEVLGSDIEDEGSKEVGEDDNEDGKKIPGKDNESEDKDDDDGPLV